MGYRSDVAYCIRFKDVPTMKEFVAKLLLKDVRYAETLNECRIEACENPEITFYEESTKWYPSYESVAMHESIFDLIDDEEFMESGVAYRFYRIGEENEDIEDKMGGDDDYDPWHFASIERHIALHRGSDSVPDGMTAVDFVSTL